jgi:hypothetical protein
MEVGLLLPNLVSDWGGFEDLVARMHEDGDVRVGRGVRLVGKSGAPRDIDVVVEHEKGPHKYVTLVECKLWNRRVHRQDVDALAASIDDLEASGGAVFTTVGYQAGAKTYAKSKGIDLFLVRDLLDEEWGAPGRVVELYLQFFSPTVRNVQSLCIPGKDGTTPRLALQLGPDGPRSPDPEVAKIENIISDGAAEMTKRVRDRRYLLCSGEDCERYFLTRVRISFDPPVHLRDADSGDPRTVLEVNLEVGTKVTQSKLRIDRGEQLDWALVVEDCVRDARFLNSRRSGAPSSEWRPHAVVAKPGNDDDVLKNGMIIGVCLKGWFDPAALEGLTEVDLESRVNHDMTSTDL